MKRILNRTDSLLILLLSAGIVLIEFNERNYTFFLTWLLMMILYLQYGSVLIYSFVRSYKDKLSNRFYLNFFPFILGALLIPIMILSSNYFRNNGFKSIVLEAGHKGGRNGSDLTLFRDNTFQLLNSGPFGGAYVRGHYRYLHDTLYLDTNKVGNFQTSGMFVMKSKGVKQKYFEPVSWASPNQGSLLVHKDYLTSRKFK